METRGVVPSEVITNPAMDAVSGVPLLGLASISRDLIQIDPRMPLEECLMTLKANGITSAPVQSEEGQAFIDALDIIEYVITQLKTTKASASVAEFEREVAETPVERITNYSRRDAYLFLSEAADLGECIRHFTSGTVHRCAIGRTSGAKSNVPMHICSQIDVVQFLASEIRSDRNLGSRTSLLDMTDLSIGRLIEGIYGPAPREPYCLYSDVILLEVCEAIVSENLSTVGLIDPETEILVGSFSPNDFLYWGKDDFFYFLRPTTDYLCAKQSNTGRFPVTVRRTATFASILNMMSTMNLHTIWVVDENYEPIHHISLTDIMRIVVSYRMT